MEQVTLSRAKLEQALYEAELLDYEDNPIVESYSGRGMYGTECFGLRLGIKDMVKLFMKIQELFDLDKMIEPEYADFYLALESFQIEQLGHGEIVYFPGFVLG